MRKNKSIDQGLKGLIFPAMIPDETAGRQKVYFFFSIQQIGDIIREVNLYPVPFTPSYLEGVAEWQNEVIPVLSIEKVLGFRGLKNTTSNRFLMVRTGNGQQGLLRVGAGLRILALPIPCTPVSSADWISRIDLIRGIYKWKEGFLVIVNLDSILKGENKL